MAHDTIFPTLAQLQAGEVHRGSFLLGALSKYEVDQATDCWLFTGGRDRHGYGKIYFQNRRHQAHRVFYATMVAAIPEGAVLRHSCDNPPCCNPAHQSVGSQADNLRDAYSRRRREPIAFMGEDNPVATITAATARAVIALVDRGVPTRDIVAQLKVNRHHVNNIKTGRTWGHVTGRTSTRASASAPHG